MSTIRATSAVNPYSIDYSSSDIIGADTTLSAASTSSTTSTNGTTSSSGTYSQGLVSSMSGFDVNSMVTQMMASDYTKLNQLLATQQKSQWTQDMYRSEITNLNDFSDNYFSSTSANNVLGTNSFAAFAATSSDAASVTVTPLNTAKAGNYTISQATLATNASMSNLSTDTSLKNTSLFSSLTGGATSGTIALNVNGKSVNFTYTSNSTIGDVMSGLSSQAGVNFSYSELTKTFSVASTTTGLGATISMSSAGASGSPTNLFLTNALGYNVDGATSDTTVTKAGADGNFTIQEPNGAATNITESSNNFTIDGLNYNVTNNIKATDKPVTINVASNISGVVSKIQDFVTAYNNLTTGINEKISERTDYNYKPLTYAQEAKMTTAQVTSWNAKAQQGSLAGDDELTNLQSEMRAAFYSTISGSGLTMQDLGLKTSNDAKQGGKLTFNAATLTTTLQKKPNDVINYLTQTSTTYPYKDQSKLTTDQYKTKYNEEGVFQRLNDIVTKYAGTHTTDALGNRGLLVNKAGLASDATDKSTLGKTLKQQLQSVTDYKTQIKNDKKRYTSQYTALQSALSQMSSQQSALTSMLGSSNG